MKVIEITVSCDTDGCHATVTVEGYSLGQARQLLAALSWPQTRGLTDHCPQHRRKEARR